MARARAEVGRRPVVMTVGYAGRTLDEFVAAIGASAAEARERPEYVKSAPHRTRVSRLDEVRAARQPRLRWRRAGS